ncbi:MAG: hypothetical protein WCE48_00985 [Steroidobacteraceae bacterium]
MRASFGLFAFLLAARVDAAVVVAVSCSSADVGNAIARASDGDTVNIPGGSCSWSSAISTAKGISIVGAGQGVTTITGGGFDINTPTGKSWRLSGMTFKGTTGIGIYGASKSFRVDHVTFDGVTGRPENRIVWVEPGAADYVAGVLDHNIFKDPHSIQVHYRGPSQDGGNASWMRPLGLGGPDAVYIEDNEFSQSSYEVSSPLTDCDGGGRIVFRHNNVKNSYFEMHDAIIGGLRACRKWEVYENTFQMTYAAGMCSFIAMRGGTGVVFNNTFLSTTDCYPEVIQMSLYRTYQTGGDPWGALCSTSTGKACLNTTSTGPKSCSSDSQCGGAAGSCVAIDGSATNPNGYLCRDQTASDGNNPQVSKPALFWNNKYGNTFVDPVVWGGGGTKPAYLQRDRDYCVGTSAMPATCNGVAVDYKPFTYPHPLAVGQTAPEPPVSLSVTYNFAPDLYFRPIWAEDAGAWQTY